MIISVGGSPEPIVVTIAEHKPEFVCFLASQQTVEKIGAVKDALRGKGVNILDYKVICDDHEDLLNCYSKAAECAQRIAAQGFQPDEVLVDYTGGTKSMTAALALATVGQGYSFSYVAGRERNKNGVGTVVSGTEVVKRGISPWQIYAVEEKKRISVFLKTFQYEAAIATMRETMVRLGEAEQETWAGIIDVLEGYLAWDNFDHLNAIRYMSSGLRRLEICAKFGLSPGVVAFLKKSETGFGLLQEINDKTQYFKKMHPVMISDLLANSRRRYQQNKYDDAVARLYRALEMIGQLAFEEAIGCPTSDVDFKKLPEELREEYVRRYRSPDDEKMRLPLFATFRVLKQVGHHAGTRFWEHEAVLRKLLSSRNDSILAHGVKPVTKETYEKFAEIIQELFAVEDPVEFPVLDW